MGYGDGEGYRRLLGKNKEVREIDTHRTFYDQKVGFLAYNTRSANCKIQVSELLEGRSKSLGCGGQ